MPSKVFVSTAPFGAYDELPRRLLDGVGAAYSVNPLNRRLKEGELAEMISDADALIAGTEPITDQVMAAAPKLRLIGRVGIGLDHGGLLAARPRNTNVPYTPDAPAAAVAELAIGHIIAALRGSMLADRRLREGHWTRHFGRRLGCVTVGVIGAGRIGGRVIRLLSA